MSVCEHCGVYIAAIIQKITKSELYFNNKGIIRIPIEVTKTNHI